MLKEISIFINKILHSITGCPDKDLHYVNDSFTICTECDRKHFIFKSY